MIDLEVSDMMMNCVTRGAPLLGEHIREVLAEYG